MTNRIDNNTILASQMEMSAKGVLSDVVVVRNIRESYVLDANGKRTDQIDCIRYDCVDPNTFDTFTAKVLTSKPVISKEALEASDVPVYIEIPVEETIIRPYSIEYGRVKVSIIAPYVKLAGK